ncbi:zinc-dependent alcohol dehydrogenase [Corynebacterium comes]|uniref:L-threonine 3-dehydrogenase n=1 Tax=Corynebacterium comes TaxID=2675218 RepID=A0A6B8VDU1_9CORY|nr:alcohol dehydrogenase catalytic domain-containing protein [Corynebacterium comes]QGU03402.1 L-threonine 3-dehydrogenase [Corynebacterium comes]
MRAIIKPGPQPGAEYQINAPEPIEVPAGHIKVQIAAASVCGSDRSMYQYNDAAAAFRPELPKIMGHEGSGTIVEIGGGITGFTPGDRVAFDSHVACYACFQCQNDNPHLCENMQLLGYHTDGLFAEYVVVPVQAAFKLPHDFNLEEAALLEPAGVAMHAIQASEQPLLSKRVLITGGGPVGLFIAELARIAGAAKVVVVEPNPYRREFAESLGAIGMEPNESIPEQLREMSQDRHGFDVGFEASGHPSSFPTILNSLRTGGTFVSVGFGRSLGEFDAAEYLNRRNITFKGCFGRRLWSTWDLLSVLIAEDKLKLSTFITHRLPLSEFERAIELLSEDSCKVILLPQES